MGCSCFSNIKEPCDHTRNEKWTIEITDNDDEQITVPDEVVRQWTEARTRRRYLPTNLSM